MNARSAHHPSLLRDKRPRKQPTARLDGAQLLEEVFDRSGSYLTFSLRLVLSHSCATFHPQLTTLTLQPLGCRRGANSPSALSDTCVCCLFVTPVFSKCKTEEALLRCCSCWCAGITSGVMVPCVRRVYE